MEIIEEFEDELASLNFNDESGQEKKPLHRNRKFWLPVGIVFIAIIVTIVVVTSGGSTNIEASPEILPGFGDGSADGDFNSVPAQPTSSPKTKPPTMPPTVSPPTGSPSVAVVYDPPSAEDCQVIAQGQTVNGQSGMIQHSFQVPMDVVLSDNTNIIDESAIVQQLQDKLQTKIMPNMAGCSTRRKLRNGSFEMEEQHRQLDAASSYVVANAQSQVAAQLIGCQMSNSLNCLHIVVSLNLHLKGTESTDALMRLISDTFAPPEGMLNKLELTEPIEGLWISSVATSVPFVPPPTPSPTAFPLVQPSPAFTPIRYEEDDDGLYDDDADDDDDLYDDDADDDDDLYDDDADDDDDVYDDDADDDDIYDGGHPSSQEFLRPRLLAKMTFGKRAITRKKICAIICTNDILVTTPNPHNVTKLNFVGFRRLTLSPTTNNAFICCARFSLQNAHNGTIINDGTIIISHRLRITRGECGEPQISESLQDELEQQPKDTTQPGTKPIYRNNQFWVTFGILLIGCIIGIVVVATGDPLALPLADSAGITSPLSNDSVETSSGQHSAPTRPPSDSSFYDPPSTEECEAVVKGETLHQQQDQIQRSFKISMNLPLANDIEQQMVLQELHKKTQTIIMPIIVGCATATIRRNMRDFFVEGDVKHHRQLVLSPYVAANAQAGVETDPVACTTNDYFNCIHEIVNVDLYLKGVEHCEDLLDFVSSVFRPAEGIVELLDLG
ncbi:MAG: hypothetical protein SGBAC_010155 [Bacillariaceae sp.]